MKLTNNALLTGAALLVLATGAVPAGAQAVAPADQATSGSGASSTAPPSTGPAQAGPSEPDRAASTGLNDIIVTANKRSERALEVPGAITAFTGADLLARGATSIRDFAGFTPGLQFNNSFGTGTPVIRGITQGRDTSPTVASVVNGAPTGSSSTLNFGAQDTLDLDPIDLERVEVLKGPQGTLYGANTLGGLISYTLRTPSLTQVTGTFRSEGDLTAHGQPSYSERGFISAPLVTDRVGLGLSAYYSRDGGYIDNNARMIRDQNGERSYGGRAALLLAPTSKLRISLNALYQNTDLEALSLVAYNLATGKPRDSDLHYDEYVIPRSKKRIYAGIANIDYDFGFASLSSVTSLQRVRSSIDQNFTGSALTGLIRFFGPFGGPAFPAPILVNQNNRDSVNKFTQELRLTSNGDRRLSYILGGFYSNENSDNFISVSGRTPTGATVSTVNPSIIFEPKPTLREYSGFANATFKITPRLDVTGGIRAGNIKQSYDQNYGGTDAAALNAIFVNVLQGFPIPAVAVESRSSQSFTTYLASLRYHFSPDGIIFARYATGFRPGGPNLLLPGLPPTFGADRTINYEAGVKTKFLGGRGSIDLTAYRTLWHDIIVQISSNGVPGFTNGGQARVQGIEGALSLRPVAQLTLTATGAYSRGKITQASAIAATSLAVGDRLPYNPVFSGSLSGEYRVPVSARLSAFLNAALRYSGDRDATFRSIQSAPYYRLPAYTLVDLRGGIETRRYDLELFIKNVGDERAQLGAQTGGGFGEVSVERPRTFGLAGTVKF